MPRGGVPGRRVMSYTVDCSARCTRDLSTTAASMLASNCDWPYTTIDPKLSSRHDGLFYLCVFWAKYRTHDAT